MSLFEEPRELLPYDGSALLYDWVLGDQSWTHYMSELGDQVRWGVPTIRMFGKEYLQPREVAWYGDPGCEYTYSGSKMELLEWIPPVLELKAIAEEKAGVVFNSVLINRYRDGNDKVSWHSDDEPELGSQPTIASISLGATRRFKFRHLEDRTVVEAELTSGSLVVMSGLSQKCWEHEIPRQTAVKEPRINLTFRTVIPRAR